MNALLDALENLYDSCVEYVDIEVAIRIRKIFVSILHKDEFILDTDDALHPYNMFMVIDDDPATPENREILRTKINAMIEAADSSLNQALEFMFCDPSHKCYRAVSGVIYYYYNYVNSQVRDDSGSESS